MNIVNKTLKSPLPNGICLISYLQYKMTYKQFKSGTIFPVTLYFIGILDKCENHSLYDKNKKIP